jgi:hypothetical protein
MPRKLRIGNELDGNIAEENYTAQENKRLLRIDYNPDMWEKVDNLFTAKKEMKAKEEAFKAQTMVLARKISALEEELLEYAEKSKVFVINGRKAVLKYKPKMSRKIMPDKFLHFLKSLGKATDFWKYVKINLKEPINDYGENILETSNVLDFEVNPYGKMDLYSKD